MKSAIACLSAARAAVCLFAADDTVPTFAVETRMVEVYATVLDHKGRYLAGLNRDQFTVRDNGQPQPISVFESASSGDVSCGILLDTTGSMEKDLEAVKRAISGLIDDLPSGAKVAVFTFSNSLQTIQPFTDNRAAAKQKLARVRARGATALFDAIANAARAINRQKGKKFLIVFTDGNDNASVLTANLAIDQAKKVGIPVYAIAEGEAARNHKLLDTLKDIAVNTGGNAFRVKKAEEVGNVLEDVNREMSNTYLLAYKAPAADSKSWRRIDLAVAGVKGAAIRAKQGYLP